VRGTAVRSAFTAALIAGLDTGEADIDGDGMVSVDDAYEYVRRQLAEHVHRQSPRKWEFDVQGRIVLAHPPRSATAVPPAAAPPAVLPSHHRHTDNGGGTPVVRRPVWWAGLGLVAVTTALAAALLTWWPLSWAFSTSTWGRAWPPASWPPLPPGLDGEWPTP
jgi:hypothetical protein